MEQVTVLPSQPMESCTHGARETMVDWDMETLSASQNQNRCHCSVIKFVNFLVTKIIVCEIMTKEKSRGLLINLPSLLIFCLNTQIMLLSQVRDLEKLRVVYVACGSRDAQTLAATENGQLWAWGDGSHGKLGRVDLVSSVSPVLVKDFGKEGIAQIECGAQFSILLTKSGKVYTWYVGVHQYFVYPLKISPIIIII